MSYKPIFLSVEKFIDYLSPMVEEFGTEVIQLESPSCRDRDGYGYLAKSRFILYGLCTEYDEQKAIEMMAEDMRHETECRVKQEEHYKCDMHTKRLGIYNINLQEDFCSDEDLEKYHRDKDNQNAILLWVRYAWGDKDRKLMGEDETN